MGILLWETGNSWKPAKFNEAHHKSMENKKLLVSVQNKPCKETEPIDETTIIKALKAGKGTDIYGLTSEHIKVAHSQLVSIIIKLIN